MDAVDFLRARARMCRKFDNCADGCPIGEQVGSCKPLLLGENAEQAVAVVEQWAQEHPGKTRQSELLELYPSTIIGRDGVLSICPRILSEDFRSEGGGCYDLYRSCLDCRREFWMQEVK